MARISGTSSVPPSDVVTQANARRGNTPGNRWVRIGAVVILIAAAFTVSRTCQKDQVRVSKDQAVATAKRQIEFTPTRTVVRLLRQGLGARPYWVVSLSIPKGDDLNTQVFKQLAIVRVDANTGKVADVKVQR